MDAKASVRTLNEQRNARRWKGSDERYTPPWLLERVTAFLGQGWYDPCPASYGKSPAVNGLAVSWAGRVYCNPPYSRMAPWVSKFLSEPFTEGLLLVPAYTDVRWFQPLYAYPLLFLRGRLRFVAMDGTANGNSPFGSVMVYRGERIDHFAQTFSDYGCVLAPLPQMASEGAPSLFDEVTA